MAEEKNEQVSGGAFGWDDGVDSENNGKEFKILPEGTALFTVVKLERTRKPFGTYGTINVAILHLAVRSDVDGSSGEVKVNIGLHHDFDWKITQFFTSIGHRKHGDKGVFVPNWGTIVDAVGKCKVLKRSYVKKTDKPGEKTGLSNDIDEFMPIEDEPASDGKLAF